MKRWYNGLQDRFQAFPSDVQILHLVSDLNKARNLMPAGRESGVNHLYRAVILLDYIVADEKWRDKRRELLRLREAIGSLIALDKPYGTIEQVIAAALQMDVNAYRRLKNISIIDERD